MSKLWPLSLWQLWAWNAFCSWENAIESTYICV